MEAAGLADKAVEMAKVSAKGGFYLFWGIVISTVVSAVGVIVLARIMQPEDYGFHMIALAAPNLIFFQIGQATGAAFLFPTVPRQ